MPRHQCWQTGKNVDDEVAEQVVFRNPDHVVFISREGSIMLFGALFLLFVFALNLSWLRFNFCSCEEDKDDVDQEDNIEENLLICEPVIPVHEAEISCKVERDAVNG